MVYKKSKNTKKQINSKNSKNSKNSRNSRNSKNSKNSRKTLKHRIYKGGYSLNEFSSQLSNLEFSPDQQNSLLEKIMNRINDLKRNYYNTDQIISSFGVPSSQNSSPSRPWSPLNIDSPTGVNEVPDYSPEVAMNSNDSMNSSRNDSILGTRLASEFG